MIFRQAGLLFIIALATPAGADPIYKSAPYNPCSNTAYTMPEGVAYDGEYAKETPEINIDLNLPMEAYFDTKGYNATLSESEIHVGDVSLKGDDTTLNILGEAYKPTTECPK